MVRTIPTFLPVFPSVTYFSLFQFVSSLLSFSLFVSCPIIFVECPAHHDNVLHIAHFSKTHGQRHARPSSWQSVSNDMRSATKSCRTSRQNPSLLSHWQRSAWSSIRPNFRPTQRKTSVKFYLMIKTLDILEKDYQTGLRSRTRDNVFRSSRKPLLDTLDRCRSKSQSSIRPFFFSNLRKTKFTQKEIDLMLLADKYPRRWHH